MTDANKTDPQPSKDIDTLIEDLRTAIQPNDHHGASMTPGFAQETPYHSTDTVQPEITSDTPSLTAQAEGAAPGRSTIPVPAPPARTTNTQQLDERDKGAPLAEGLGAVAQAVDEQDKDLRENYGAGMASDQGPPPEAAEKSRRTMGGNTLR